MSASCSSCGQPVRWAETPAGKPTPLDPDPDQERGTVAGVLLLAGKVPIAGTVLAVTLSGEALATARRRDVTLYVSHFATCPNAAQHRRRPTTPGGPDDRDEGPAAPRSAG